MRALRLQPEFIAFLLFSTGYFFIRSIFGVPFELSLWVFLLMTVGMYHGSYDLCLMRRVSRSPSEFLKNLLLYSFLGGVLLGVWFFWPSLFMAVFLLETIFHFGSDDTLGKGISSFGEMSLRGLLPIVASAALYPDDVLPFFTVLLGSAVQAENWMAILAAPAPLLPLLLPLLFFSRKWPEALQEIAALAAVFVLLPPPFSFGLYFVTLHSFRHLRDVQLATSENMTAIFFDPLGWTVTAIVALPLIIILTTSAVDHSYWSSYPFVVFACLTLPHAFFQLRVKKKILILRKNQ